jgi:hypothetical protein
MKLFIGIFFVFFVFFGCSNRQYFSPLQTISSYDATIHTISQPIKTLNKNGATLKDNKIITKDGILKYKLPDNYSFINKNNKTILAVNNYKQLLVKNKHDILTFTFEQNVIAGALNKNCLALIFEDNTIAIYDINSKKFKFKEYQKSSLINDHRIANPIFLENIVLFPTLNGQIVIVDNKNYKTIGTMTIDADTKINNIIFLKTIGDTMIASTPNRILSLSNNTITTKEYTIKDIILHDKFIYIATLEGEIIKFDLLLNVIKSKKFKFADIYSLAFGSKLYALESQGYLIELTNDFNNTKIYNFDFDSSYKTLALDNILYFDDKYIQLK